MIVDDEIDITTLFEELLVTLGFKVTSFNNPLIALESFKENHNDIAIVLSDMRMPELTGLELFKEISKMDIEVKIIIMTAFDINVDEIKEINITQFLRKPINMEQLGYMMSNYVHSKAEEIKVN